MAPLVVSLGIDIAALGQRVILGIVVVVKDVPAVVAVSRAEAAAAAAAAPLAQPLQFGGGPAASPRVALALPGDREAEEEQHDADLDCAAAAQHGYGDRPDEVDREFAHAGGLAFHKSVYVIGADDPRKRVELLYTVQ